MESSNLSFIDPKDFQHISEEIKPQVEKSRPSIDKKYIIAGLGVGFLIIIVVIGITKWESIKAWNERTSIFGNINKGISPITIKEPEKPITNPLTGVKYTVEEASSWKDIRPLAVMINNHVDARPQAGLIDADFTYEIVAEGGITRFLAFYQSVLPDKIGPIRSTREYYLTLVKEMGDAMLMHHGYSPQALTAIETWPVRSLQRGDAPYWRDNPRNVAYEHTLYASGKEVVARGLELGWEGKSDDFYVWKFKDTKDLYSTYSSAVLISYDFWYPGDFSVEWQYDENSNTYLRFMGYDALDKPVPHADDGTGKQISASNVIVQFVTENAIAGDDKSRLYYDFIGSGNGFIFLDGKVIEATWSKASRDARTMYYDKNGSEIQFNRGKFFVSVLPDRNTDSLKFSAPEITTAAPIVN